MNLYTVLVEFRGGTYIKQLRAANQADIPKLWQEKCLLEVAVLAGVSPKLIDLSEEDTVVIDNSVGVWCVSTSTEKGLLLMHIVRTADELSGA